MRAIVALVAAALSLVVPDASAAPPNDECSGAIVAGLSRFEDRQDTNDATRNPSDGVGRCGCNENSNSVWYRLEPTSDRVITVDTLGSAYETVVEVFEGACGAARPVECNDGNLGNQTRVTFSGCANREYLVRVSDSCDEGGGSLRFNVTSQSGALDIDGDGRTDCRDNCPTVENEFQEDRDGDGVGDDCDNCLLVPNPDQTNTVPGSAGDACADDDADGLVDAVDNCPSVANPGQDDADGDTVGDACDACSGQDDRLDFDHDRLPDACDSCTDTDGDGFGNPGFAGNTCADDNCPESRDPVQLDTDGDGAGDVCDDGDGDLVADAFDNCPLVANAGQDDADGDDVGDACDPCTDPDGDGFGTPGHPAATCADDNCPTTGNPDQLDGDGDGVGDACTICAALGAAGRYPTMARKHLSTKEIVSYGYWSMGTNIQGPACTKTSNLQGTYVYEDYTRPGHLIATASRGTAVRFQRHRKPYAHQVPNTLDGDVITGGGKVVNFPERNELDVLPFFDTSGTRPEVDQCKDGMADALQASATLAAMPPRLTFGDIVVPVDDSVDLDLRGGGAVQIDSIVLVGQPVRHNYYGLPHVCLEDGGELYIDVDPGDQLVINVDHLAVGNCTSIYVDEYDATVVMNLPGRGRRINIGIESDTYDGLNILAPERRVDVVGAGTDIGTYFGSVLANRLQLLGYAEQFTESLPCATR